MTQTIRAIYENGVLRPLDDLARREHEEVRVTVESGGWGDGPAPDDDPLAGLRVHTGIPDLAENIDDYRFGGRTPPLRNFGNGSAPSAAGSSPRRSC